MTMSKKGESKNGITKIIGRIFGGIENNSYICRQML